MNASEITRLRKSGQVEEAYQLGKQLLHQNESDPYVRMAYAWVLWQKVKELPINSSSLPDLTSFLAELVELQLEDNDYSALLFDTLRTAIAKQTADLKQDDTKEAWLVSQQLDSLFQLISQLPLKRFSEYRAYFIKSFSDDRWVSVVDFAEWIGWDTLDTSEYEQTEYQGRRFASAGELLVNAMCKQLLNSSSAHSIHQMKELLLRLQDFSNDQGRKFQYLRYYVARMMLATNEYRAEEIISYFTPYVKTKGNNPWVWEFLADIYAQAGDDAHTLAALSQAALLGNKEEFKVGIRGKIATIFVKHKRYLEASYEVSVVLDTYQRMGWKVPVQILEMCQMPWYQEPEKGYSNNALYKQYTTLIDSSLLPQKKTTGKKQVFVLTEHNPQKQIYHFTSEEQVRGHFKHTAPLELGGVYSGCFQPPKKVGGFVKMEGIKPLDATHYPQLVCRVKGKFKLLTGGYGFVNKYYVAAPLVQQETLEDGRVYDALCVLSYERKKERFTMVVCKILRQ